MLYFEPLPALPTIQCPSELEACRLAFLHETLVPTQKHAALSLHTMYKLQSAKVLWRALYSVNSASWVGLCDLQMLHRDKDALSATRR